MREGIHTFATPYRHSRWPQYLWVMWLSNEFGNEKYGKIDKALRLLINTKTDIMKSNNSLQCLYYPSSVIKTSPGLASFCLYYDDVFLLVPQWESLSTGLYLENHQKYVASDEYIASCVSLKDKRARRNILNSMMEMETAFFLGDNHLLVQENVIQIIYPDIHAKDWNFPSAASEFMKDTADQIHVVEDLIKQYKELSKSYDDYFFRWIFHALLLAINLELIPVADCRLPISLKTAEQPSSENISAILAEECLRLALPRCAGAKPEDILDVRHKLADELYAFRMAMKKLCFILNLGSSLLLTLAR